MSNPYSEFEYGLNDVVGTGPGDAGMMREAAVVTSVVGGVETGDGGVLLKVVGWIHPAAMSVTTIYTRNNADKKYDGIVFPFIQPRIFPLI